jgi:3-hydroxyacyl-CoA dehydrogenase
MDKTSDTSDASGTGAVNDRVEGTAGAESVRQVSVIGAGTMGYGIALAYVIGGREVALYDVASEALERARHNVQSGLDTLAEAGRLPEDEADAIADRIAYQTDLETTLQGSDFVTEAVPEDAELKRETFEYIDEYAPSDAVLATNTSGLSITEISEAVADPARFLGTHWFNPAHVVPGVEVIRGEETDDAAVELTTDLLESVGKTPIVVERDIRGFIGNRLQLAMAHEAFSLLDRGVADAATIDRAVESTFGFRLPASGIFEKVDQSGLDVQQAVTEYLVPDLDRGTEPHDALADRVEAGELGVKTGTGVYDWSDRSLESINEERDRELLALLEAYESNASK